MNLLLEIITPEKTIFKEDVDEVIVPTTNGEITILRNHVNLLTTIAPGALIAKKGSDTHPIAITGGFIEVNNNKINILADYAIRAQDIEIAQAEEAKKRAEKIMQEKTSDNDFRIAQGELLKSLLELQIPIKHKTKPKI